MMKYLLSSFFTCLCFCVFSQTNNWHIGFIPFDATRPKITGFGSTLIDSAGYNRRTYDINENQYRWSHTTPRIMIDGAATFEKVPLFVAGQLEFGISFPNERYGFNAPTKDTLGIKLRQRSNFEYWDNSGLRYTVNVNYKYLVTNLLIKGGFSLSENRLKIYGIFGLSSESITENSELYYNSTSKIVGQDAAIQQVLRGVLKGKNNTSWVYGGGIQLCIRDDSSKEEEKKNFSVFAQYLFRNGQTDAIETLSNSYGFKDNKNRMYSHDISVGFMIAIF